jgi:3-oxoadipate enol-lactonase
MVPVGDLQIATYELGRGKPIVMINGLGASAQDWGPLVELLAEHARVITFDNRGAGSSSIPTEPFSLEQMADDAVAVFEAYGLRSAYLLGHSMGGMIAQLVALRRPELVERLVLMATHAGSRSAVPSTPEARAAMFPQEKLPRHELVRRQYSIYVARSFLEDERDTFERMMQVRLANLIPFEAWQLQLQAILQSERTEQLAALRVPTLIVHGREDTLIPFGNGEKLRALIPNARLAALDDCGHLPNWEKPAAVTAVVCEFFGV